MTAPEPYPITETLDKGTITVLQRGPRSRDGDAVIIKHLYGGAPSSRAVERLWLAYMIVCPSVSKSERVSVNGGVIGLRAAQGPTHSRPLFAEEDRACNPHRS